MAAVAAAMPMRRPRPRDAGTVPGLPPERGQPRTDPMSKRAAALLFAALTVTACSNASPTGTPPAIVPQATPAGTSATATQGAGAVDPNTMAGFCQLMTDTIVAN